MSKILSYSSKTSKNVNGDWIPVEPYSDDDIAQIKDPDGGLSSNPRTAIPSPFAQIDLVKNAFNNLANPQLHGAAMNERLVSNALDVAQLLFDYENHKDYLRIITWNRKDELARLTANSQHRLYGETLELFLKADKVYNFDDLDEWYFLLWDNKVIGGTSPASVVMAAPVAGTINQINELVNAGCEIVRMAVPNGCPWCYDQQPHQGGTGRVALFKRASPVGARRGLRLLHVPAV